VDADEIELTIEKLVAGGEGLGRWQGVPIFVPRSAPGDHLRVQIVERHTGYGRAEITEIRTAGPGRRIPPCVHFADCGGCDLQHLEDDVQLRLKSAATLETLRRLSGGEVPPPRRILSANAWGYRTRTQIHTRGQENGAAVGYLARRSHRLVPIASCAVLAPPLERAVLSLAGTRELLPSRVDLALGDNGEIAAAPPLAAIPGAELVRRVAGFDLRFDARCFFQVHLGLLERFVEVVVGEWRGERAFDLYGGVGLFALPLTRRYERVALVEGERVAARYARRNARQAATGVVEVFASSVEGWIGAGLPDRNDRVLVDPPRAGLPAVVRRLLVARRPRRLTYVSCHAATLARDLQALREAFRIESVDLVDLFPQTGHMETVVQLVDKEES